MRFYEYEDIYDFNDRQPQLRHSMPKRVTKLTPRQLEVFDFIGFSRVRTDFRRP